MSKYELRGEHLIPGLTEAELAESRFPLPDRSTLTEEEQASYDYVVDRSKRFFFSVPANEGHDYRLTPFFQGLLRSPKLAELWARFGDFYQPAETRGSFSSRDRELAELTISSTLARQTRGKAPDKPQLAAIHVADAVGVGLDPKHIEALAEERFDELEPQDRQLVEYVQATIWSELTPEMFEALAARMGDKVAIEFTSYVTYRVGNLRTVRAMWDIMGRERNTGPSGWDLLQAYLDGTVDPEQHSQDRAYNWVADPAKDKAT